MGVIVNQSSNIAIAALTYSDSLDVGPQRLALTKDIVKSTILEQSQSSENHNIH